MATQSQPTQTQVLDAVSRAALTLEPRNSEQQGLQQLLNEFREALVKTAGSTATTVLYNGKLTTYLRQHPADYPETVASLRKLLARFSRSV
ncbi:hypothetical protein [Lactiplantibacillus modestisalitolerans]|uniref:Bacteriocin immunity protein n=1 Tax=Lactiplantibacillus modestisalitolerans TaxID=1457219 RepID=A0ABV5WS22_9LACO|nr:hypothetical protein [Lactiplantibacillus modestisalitolerans]